VSAASSANSVGARLDHLVYAVPDLAAGVREFTAATGIRPTAGGRHVGRGTANYLVGLGNNAYLEIIGPDPDEPAPPERLTFGIERLTSSQLITWAVAVTDIDTTIARSRAHGYDPGDATTMSRRTADGELLQWRLTPDTVRDRGGVVPFLIDWGVSIHPTSRSLPSVGLESLRAISPQPDLTRRQLGALEVDLVIEEGPVAQLQARLRLPGREAILVS
jgi:hypothetical protein